MILRDILWRSIVCIWHYKDLLCTLSNISDVLRHSVTLFDTTVAFYDCLITNLWHSRNFYGTRVSLHVILTTFRDTLVTFYPILRHSRIFCDTVVTFYDTLVTSYDGLMTLYDTSVISYDALVLLNDILTGFYDTLVVFYQIL